MENNYQTMMYYALREEYLEQHGRRMPVALLGASDSHGTIVAGLFDRKFSVIFAKSRSAGDILDAIRAGNTTAVEIFEADYSRRQELNEPYSYNVHGSLRLASYARFLCEHYFPRTRLLGAVEGELMREYTLGIPGTAEQLAARSRCTDDFFVQFRK